MKRLLELAAGSMLACALAGPARVCAQALILSRARERYPEMFDGALALANIDAAIEDALGRVR